MASHRQSHQTTIRFSQELWERLELAAAQLEVSVAQYVRDAARTRLDAQDGPGQMLPEPLGSEVAAARSDAREQLQDSAALWEQGRLARMRASQLREESARHRERQAETPAPQPLTEVGKRG